MGTWQEDTAPREPTPLGVQGRPITISRNKPNLSHYKALCARRLFVQRPHIVPIFGTPALKLQRYWIPPGPSRLCKGSRLHADILTACSWQSTMKWKYKTQKKKNTWTNERNTKDAKRRENWWWSPNREKTWEGVQWALPHKLFWKIN